MSLLPKNGVFGNYKPAGLELAENPTSEELRSSEHDLVSEVNEFDFSNHQ